MVLGCIILFQSDEFINKIVAMHMVWDVIIQNHYNMVGVAVAMVIPTMHEKSCIDLHNAR